MLRGRGLLQPLQKKFLTFWATLPDQSQFYLTGGTALAEFYLGHRFSYDLDLFTTEERLIVPVSREIEAAGLRQGFRISVIRRFATYVEFLVAEEGEEVRVELALDSPFRFAPPVLSEYGMWVNDFLDLKVDKLLAYYGRAEPRDAVDLYYILQEESVERLLDLAGQKDPGFDLYWFTVALSRAADFPDQADAWPVKTVAPFDAGEIKRFFQSLALRIMSRVQDGP